MKIAIIILAVLIATIGSASAYQMPTNEQTGAVMHDSDVFNVAMQHHTEAWAQDALIQLEQNYTNHNTLSELVSKMAWLKAHEAK
jgi:hypothetical protein